MNVAIVDDSAAIRSLVKRLLLVSGRYDVVAEGGTVADAVRIYREQRPAVMFLDVEMPDGSGLEALRSINCPVVVLSTRRKAGTNMDLRHAVFLDKENLNMSLDMAIAQAVTRCAGMSARGMLR